MFEYLIINQQMPGQQPQQQMQQSQAPQQPAQQQPAVQVNVQQAQQQQQMQQPQAQAAPAPGGSVNMVPMLQWAGIGGAASGAIQGALSVVSGFDVVGFLMTVGISIVLGILVAIILGQAGSKIPLQATLMVKAAAFMFVLNLIAGFVLGMGSGAMGMILGVVGIGAGAFLYGWLLQKKLPNLI